jgi:circadian clock protein KaiC
VFISFEETAEAVRTNALSIGWDLEALEREGLLAIITPQIDHRAVRAGEFNINGLLAILFGQAERLGARLLIIDAIDALGLFGSQRREDELYGLHDWLVNTASPPS